MNELEAVTLPSDAVIENVLIKGDLRALTPKERATYYLKVCHSLRLNPLTRPFEYLHLSGKLILYATRNCTDQLRTIHNVSVEELTESMRDTVFIVTCKVKNSAGRTDISKGAVTIGQLKGEALANALMKCETKAKRRATLSLCGLSTLDETELETLPPHDIETGELLEDSAPDPTTLSPEAGSPAPPDKVVTPPRQGGAGASFMIDARTIAKQGVEPLRALWRKSNPAQRVWLETNMPELEALYPDATAAPHDAEWVGPADADDQAKVREAYQAGLDAKKIGGRRSAIPGEYREDKKLERAWVSGFNGESPPMV